MDYVIDSESSISTDDDEEDLKNLHAVLEADEALEAKKACSSNDSIRSWCPIKEPSSPGKDDEYSKIETALALNKLTDEKLIRLERILVQRLHQCRQKLKEFADTPNFNERSDKISSFSYRNCGKPYFRDKDGFVPPDNQDTIIMKKSGMYDFSTISSIPGWTVKDKSEFLAVLLQMSREHRVKEIESKIIALRLEAKKKNISNEDQVRRLKSEIYRVKKKPLKDVALPIDFHYDWHEISVQLNRRHTPHEYCSLWKLFLHPTINKEPWSKAEHSTLQKIATKYNLQEWDKITAELNTNRTAYQCFVYFRTNMSNTFTNQKWTKEEEEYLKRLIEYYKEDDYIPWGRVAASMENRTKIQIYNKYLRLIELRKGRFLREEDAIILNCAKNYGPDFKKIKKFLPSRSVQQLRNRYQALVKRRTSTVWTVKEDRKLIQLMSNQDSVTNYSSISKHFPGKDRINIRTRYMTLIKWMQRNPNVDIINAPRRAARRLCHGHAAENLNNAIEKLKNRMQTEVDFKKSKKITGDSKEEDIDDAILAFMVTENLKATDKPIDNEELFVVNEDLVVTTGSWNATNLQKILLMLKAKLDKNLFKECVFHKTYPDLIKPEKEVCLVKVKSYSKKSIINTIKVDKAPDVWGNKILSCVEHVLPPHFATITGCKALISHVSSKDAVKLDINSLKKKNLVFRQQLYLLMERLNCLFVWPMILSNEIPKKRKLSKKSIMQAKSMFNVRVQKNFQKKYPFERDSNDERIIFEESDEDKSELLV